MHSAPPIAAIRRIRLAGDEATAPGIEGAMNVQNFLFRFLKDGSGATSIEYAFIACGVAVAIFIIIGKLSVTVESKFEQIDAGLK